MIYTICSAGYGTPAPTTDGSRLYTIFLMFFGIFVIFASISNFIGNSIQKLNSYVKKSMVKNLVEAENLFRLRLFLSISTIVSGLFFGALFFHYNEGWSFISSLHFAVETSTVSYFLRFVFFLFAATSSSFTFDVTFDVTFTHVK